ncbi:variable surface protein [Plasmodium gonderi]|uniref:Variable surface protein n=1 Tax=Plasmodium gonderi TaxID=77519 RepID=A0A1Y1JPX1_PLAGO|nr:variable surface protein [Plasmodium gonderi]GAW84260.1 variable surface protein [Plasmodium gonderi]
MIFVIDKKEDNYSKYIKEVCIKWFPYLYNIHYNLGKSAKIKEGLQYLYYWLYNSDYSKYGIEIGNNRELYMKLIKRYSDTSIAQRITPSLPQDLSDEEWIKLIDICDFNTKINYIKSSLSEPPMKERFCQDANTLIEKYMHHIVKCKSGDDHYFCNAFNNAVNKVKQLMLINVCDHFRCYYIFIYNNIFILIYLKEKMNYLKIIFLIHNVFLNIELFYPT